MDKFSLDDIQHSLIYTNQIFLYNIIVFSNSENYYQLNKVVDKGQTQNICCEIICTTYCEM